ncbi:hypothetical protein N7523_005604 [Penicillium sp. IBT 18751x]|nr:hypothetical protein N7523_005604 [Penicillium sp. IBT 18751x]
MVAGSISQEGSHDRILRHFFGDVGEAKALMERYLSLISVEPVFCKRLTIFVITPVHVLPWEIFLEKAGFELDEDWFYQETVDRRVRIQVMSSLESQFHATHEVCFVAPSGIVKPYKRSNSEKVTTVYGPKQGRWQIEELQLLLDCGWTVFYQSTVLPDGGFGNTMLRAESVSGNRALISEDTITTIASAEENNGSVMVIENHLRDAILTPSDDGIAISLFGRSG